MSSILKISSLEVKFTIIPTRITLSHRFRHSKRPRGSTTKARRKLALRGEGSLRFSSVHASFFRSWIRSRLSLDRDPTSPHRMKTSGFEIILVIVPLDRHPAPAIMIIAMIIKGNWSRAAGTRLEAMHAADAVTFLETQAEVQLHVLVQMSIEIYARDISSIFLFLDSGNRATVVWRDSWAI